MLPRVVAGSRWESHAGTISEPLRACLWGTVRISSTRFHKVSPMKLGSGPFALARRGLLILSLSLAGLSFATFAQTADSFNPGAFTGVYVAVLQTDGKSSSAAPSPAWRVKLGTA